MDSGAANGAGGSAGRSGTPRTALLLACTAVSVGLCIWGTVGWRRAYRAQAALDHLVRAEELRDVQLLQIVVRGGAAAAELALEGHVDAAAGELHER